MSMQTRLCFGLEIKGETMLTVDAVELPTPNRIFAVNLYSCLGYPLQTKMPGKRRSLCRGPKYDVVTILPLNPINTAPFLPVMF